MKKEWEKSNGKRKKDKTDKSRERKVRWKMRQGKRDPLLKRKKENRKKFTAENFPANENKISSHSWITFGGHLGIALRERYDWEPFLPPIHSFGWKKCGQSWILNDLGLGRGYSSELEHTPCHKKAIGSSPTGCIAISFFLSFSASIQLWSVHLQVPTFNF